jgi:hypothetical protein
MNQHAAAVSRARVEQPSIVAQPSVMLRSTPLWQDIAILAKGAFGREEGSSLRRAMLSSHFVKLAVRPLTVVATFADVCTGAFGR